jgi:predicted nucleic acid-binding protein
MATPANPLAPPLASAQTTPHSVVLDTNVVLDWLLFRDPACEPLAAKVTGHRLVWHATLAMRAELAHVLPRPRLLGWPAGGESVLTQFDRWSRAPAQAMPAASSPAPRCGDPDDQKFVDLACAVGARWLLSRDRALLALRKPAWEQGVEVLTPADWTRRYSGHAD